MCQRMRIIISIGWKSLGIYVSHAMTSGLFLWSNSLASPLRVEAPWLCVVVTRDDSVQIQQARLKSDEYCLKLEMTQTEVREVNESLDREKEHWKRELLGRHRELETLPDKLRRTEQLLRDTQLEAEAHERRNLEHNSALAEVRHKLRWFFRFPPSGWTEEEDFNHGSHWIACWLCPCVGGAAGRSAGDASTQEPPAAGGEQCSEGEKSQHREVRRVNRTRHLTMETIRNTANCCLQPRTTFSWVITEVHRNCWYSHMCRKLENMKVENQEVSHALASKETSIRSIEQQLEEKARECSVVSRQLQQSRDDAQRQVCSVSAVCQRVTMTQNIHRPNLSVTEQLWRHVELCFVFSY